MKQLSRISLLTGIIALAQLSGSIIAMDDAELKLILALKEALLECVDTVLGSGEPFLARFNALRYLYHRSPSPDLGKISDQAEIFLHNMLEDRLSIDEKIYNNLKDKLLFIVAYDKYTMDAHRLPAELAHETLDATLLTINFLADISKLPQRTLAATRVTLSKCSGRLPDGVFDGVTQATQIGTTGILSHAFQIAKNNKFAMGFSLAGAFALGYLGYELYQTKKKAEEFLGSLH